MTDFFSSSVGKKYIMAASGLVWVGFVFAHMLGNLLIFVGADAYNSYGHALTSGKIIFVAEAALILSLLAHVVNGLQLTLQNRRAKGSNYAVTAKGLKKASLASRTMAPQRALILAFVISHLATFKFGTVYQTTVDGVAMRDLFRLMIEVFQQPGYVAWYVVCLVLLGFHLSHGVGSLFQSLGLKNDLTAPSIQRISKIYAWVVAAGFLAQPLYVFFIHGQGQ